MWFILENNTSTYHTVRDATYAGIDKEIEHNDSVYTIENNVSRSIY